MKRVGRGMDYKESRQYMFGDDVRHLDWNASSRMNELYVKTFHEENDRVINIFLDASLSMKAKGSSGHTKYFTGFQFFAFAAIVSLIAGDRVNLGVYSNKPEILVERVTGMEALYSHLKKIYNIDISKNKTNHELPFQLLMNRFRKSSITYIVSDFAVLPEINRFYGLRMIHELYAVRVFDSIETSLGSIAKFLFIKNPETENGGGWESSFERDSEILKDFFQNRILELRTDSAFARVMAKFLSVGI
jgi:uncharacterized protein (DUF58 family)